MSFFLQSLVILFFIFTSLIYKYQKKQTIFLLVQQRAMITKETLYGFFDGIEN